MEISRINNWVQMITAIAVVFGLGLVIWELKQTRDAIRSQLTSDGFETIGQFYIGMFGEHPEEVLAKACENPTELSGSDLVVLDHVYTQLVHRSLRVVSLVNRGGYYDADYIKPDRFRRDGTGGWGLLFQSAPGRAYWRSFEGDKRLKAYGDAIYASWDGTNCRDHNAKWKALIEEEVEHQRGEPEA